MIKRGDATFLGGDFNMSLFVVADQLRPWGIQATFLGSYAWQRPPGGDAASSSSRAAPALAGRTFPGVMFDSLGLFALQPIANLRRVHNMGSLRVDAAADDPLRLDQFLAAEGYSEKSYVGEGRAIEAAFRSDTRGGGVAWQRDTLPMVKQQRLLPEVRDNKITLMGPWRPHALADLRGHP